MRQIYTPIVAVNPPCVSKTTPLCINVVVSPGKVFAPLANSMFPLLMNVSDLMKLSVREFSKTTTLILTKVCGEVHWELAFTWGNMRL